MNQKGVSALWSLREDCVGIVVGQAPLVTPMLKREFWVAIGYASPKPDAQYASKPTSDDRESGPAAQAGDSGMMVRRSGKKPADPYSLTQLGITNIGSESEENIVKVHSPTAEP